MKFMTIVAALMFVVSTAFAHEHEEKKKEIGHDKEHSHVKTDKMDHGHDDAHHGDHDHKAHHPDHKDETKTTKKKK